MMYVCGLLLEGLNELLSMVMKPLAATKNKEANTTAEKLTLYFLDLMSKRYFLKNKAAKTYLR